MKNTLLISIIVVGTVLFTSFTNLPTPQGNFVVIINKDNPISMLTPGEAKLYFLRRLKTRWPGINKNIRPATRKSKCPERDTFYNEIIKMSDTEVETYFAERQFQNAEKPPEKFNSDMEVVGFVEQEPGGIGFINSKSITPDIKSRVKIVLEF